MGSAFDDDPHHNGAGTGDHRPTADNDPSATDDDASPDDQHVNHQHVNHQLDDDNDDGGAASTHDDAHCDAVWMTPPPSLIRATDTSSNNSLCRLAGKRCSTDHPNVAIVRPAARLCTALAVI